MYFFMMINKRGIKIGKKAALAHACDSCDLSLFFFKNGSVLFEGYFFPNFAHAKNFKKGAAHACLAYS